MKNAIGVGGMQVPSRMKGFPARGVDAQDLVKLRVEEQALQLVEEE